MYNVLFGYQGSSQIAQPFYTFLILLNCQFYHIINNFIVGNMKIWSFNNI